MKSLFSKIFIYLLIVLGVAMLGTILYISSALMADISRKEATSAKLVLRTPQLVSRSEDPSLSDIYSLAGDIISGNDYLPVVLVDQDGNICSTHNLSKPDSLLTYEEKLRALEAFRARGDSSVVDLGDEVQIIYYGQSTLVDQLGYIRWLQVLVVLLFGIVVYLVVARARRQERDSIWKGLALETAHQLGPPIAALSAWRELLETGMADGKMVSAEMTKDIDRLKSVTQRFSKIGSTPVLARDNLLLHLQAVEEYLRPRISRQVAIQVVAPQGDVACPHDVTLVKWAIENITKNAADAIDGKGAITISLTSNERFAIIDIADNGRGMDATTRRHLFDAGYSTKRRGWGIGLALVKRIVCQYHHGRVSVLSTQMGGGTTIRVMLPIG